MVRVGSKEDKFSVKQLYLELEPSKLQDYPCKVI